MMNARKFHYSISDMTDAYFSIDRKSYSCYGAIPYIVIPLDVTHKMASMFQEKLSDFLFIFGHLSYNRLSFHFEKQMNVLMGFPI